MYDFCKRSCRQTIDLGMTQETSTCVCSKRQSLYKYNKIPTRINAVHAKKCSARTIIISM